MNNVQTLEPPKVSEPRSEKPRLRGWFHLVMSPISLIAGIILVVASPTTPAKVTTAIFALAGFILFTTSAVYHRGTWSRTAFAVLRRMDHANIFLLIAGSYTPLAVLLLPHDQAMWLLIIVWSGALLGILMRMFWLGAPRWVYTPVYLAISWVAVGYFPGLYEGGGAGLLTLVLLGGVAYTGGAICYAMKRPNPIPGWFGFHEIFHAGTVIGWGCHFAAITVAAMNAG